MFAAAYAAKMYAIAFILLFHPTLDPRKERHASWTHELSTSSPAHASGSACAVRSQGR